MSTYHTQKLFILSFSTLFLLLAALVLIASEIKEDNNLPSSVHLRVTGTIGMLTDIIQEVGGDRVKVDQIIGSGIDPHLYNPTRSDVLSLHQADLIFYLGFHLEGTLATLLEELSKEDPSIITIGSFFEKDKLIFHNKAVDPHVWMDVSLWSQTTFFVAEALSKHDPLYSHVYRENAELFFEELRKLDLYIKKITQSINPDQRVIVTAHDAFQYFGKAYGFTVKAIQGMSTESEASIEDINSLVSFIVEKKIPAIFVESSVPQKYVRALIEGSRAKDHNLYIAGSLFSDAMGQPGQYEGHYIGMLDHNATLIVNSLGGKTPLHGMKGTLSYYLAQQSDS